MIVIIAIMDRIVGPRPVKIQGETYAAFFYDCIYVDLF